MPQIPGFRLWHWLQSQFFGQRQMALIEHHKCFLVSPRLSCWENENGVTWLFYQLTVSVQTGVFVKRGRDAGLGTKKMAMWGHREGVAGGEDSPHADPTAILILDFHLQNHEKINSCCLNKSVVFRYGNTRKLIHYEIHGKIYEFGTVFSPTFIGEDTEFSEVR